MNAGHDLLYNARRDSEEAMPEVCEVVRTTPGGRDEYGGQLPPVETAVAATVCRIGTPTGDEAVTAGQLTASVSAKASLPHGTDVRPDDTLKINGEPYNIVAVLPGSYTPHLDVLVAKGG